MVPIESGGPSQADREGEAAGAEEGGAGERAGKRARIFAEHLRLSELTQGLKEAR